ncbi:amino acid adenylation domain-containing protein [Kitasatospora sp. NPDC052868]|uniref:amino acid adenylation domain-containing protein n=1 Tax=Kitasatospora sp. NPDC052868 TaxID=3364060 RepID=UPI0037C88963
MSLSHDHSPPDHPEADPFGPVRHGLRSAPLSAAQERLWFIDAAAHGSVTYNVPLLMRWHEPVDVPALRTALTAVVTRHEVLRTTYRVADGRPVQEVRDPGPVELAVVDLSGEPEPLRRLDEQAAAAARQPLDLAERPPLACTVWQGLPGGDAVLLNIHHIAVDGWSLGVLFEDLAAGYEAALAGRDPELPELPIQYTDFAIWDGQELAGEEARELLAERAGQLSAVPSGLALAGRAPATPREGDRPGAEHVFELPAELWAAVGGLAHDLRVTPFVVVFAAFQAVVQRWSGRDAFLLGVVAADRPEQSLEDLVGFFVNTVPQRCTVNPEESFADLCSAVRTEAFDSLGYQRIPFDRLTAALPDTPRGALVNIGFALQNYPVPRYSRPPRWERAQLLPTGAAKFDLLFILDETPAGVTGTIEYDTDCYPPALAARLAEGFRALLSAAVEAPQQTLARLPVTERAPGALPACVVPGERRDLVGRHLGGADPEHATVLDAIAARIAAADQAAPAVTCDGADLGWGELDAWSWAVAAALRELGIGPGDHVPVVATRGGALVAGWLGVLRSGAAYAPIGLDTPPDRLAHIIGRLDAKAVVVDAAGADLTGSPGPALLQLEPLRGTSAPAVPPRLTGRDTAMVIHTSGSTGRPKGVLVSHQGLLNTVLWWIEDEGLGPDGRLLCTCATSFDVANFDVIRSLAAGALLVLADDRQRRDPGALAELVRGPLGITSTSMTPSMARAALDTDAGGPTTLRTAYFAGEAVTRQLAAACTEKWGAEVRNAYGPTEASCLSTCGTVDLADERPPIGVPLPNTRAYLLGPHREELPVGVPGELYVAGVGLALGYLGRPDLTEQAFLPDPFGTGPDDRMYRTGDRVALRPDGRLDYIGRVDDQVKILGNRIEPGEVRRLLEEHPRVRAAAVLAVGEPKRLVGYLELHDGGEPPTRDEVVAPLRRWLPAAVLPAEVYAVAKLPFTQNDKLNTAALATLPAVLLPEGRAVRAELGPDERRAARLIAGILSEATGRVFAPDTGFAPDTDFFGLGGHSLLAVRLLAAAEAEAGAPVALRDFLAEPTVAGLGRLLAGAGRSAVSEGSAAPAAPASDADTSAPGPNAAQGGVATSVQQRLWFIDRLPGVRSAYLLPTVLELTGPVDRVALAGALAAVLGRHPALRARFTLDRKLRKVVYSTAGSPPEVTVTDAGDWSPEALAEHIGEVCWTPFDLAVEAPARAEVIAVGERTVVVFAAHHIVLDGWSLGLLLEQLGREYRQPGAVAFGSTGSDRSGAAEASPDSLAAVVARLTGAPTDAVLPHDRPRGAAQGSLAGLRSARLPAETTARLRALAAETGATTFMLTAAVLATALARGGGQRDFLFAFPWAGREAADAETVGMFVNTLVLRVDLRDEPDRRELLARIKAEATVCYRNADVPFDELVAALHPDRDLSRPALTPVYLAATDAPTRPGDFGPGVAARLLPLEPLHSKYELELTATDHASDLEFTLTYQENLFDAATAERLLDAVVAAATDLAAGPDADRPHRGDSR